MAAEPPPRREREVVHERPAEREVVRDGGNPFGIVAAIIGVIVVLLLVWFLFMRAPADDGVDVVPPADDNGVEIDPDIEIEDPDIDVEADGNGNGDGS